MNIDHYALSMLLHDIGKFWQRSSDAWIPTAEEKKAFCPYHAESGQYSHDHAALSARFIEEWVRLPEVTRWGPRHHLPERSSREEFCGYLADRLATLPAPPEESRETPSLAIEPLQSIWSRREPRFHALGRADRLEEALFPRPHAVLSREDYRHHWHYFLRALDQLGAPVTSLETWLSVLEVFTARMPWASTRRQLARATALNLFDHSRAVAAIAVALWRSGLELEELHRLEEEMESTEPASGPSLASLVTATLTGGREFLGPRAGAGRGPRVGARALFLDLLAGAIGRRLLEELELPVTSLLGEEPGSILALAPAGVSGLDSIRDTLDSLLGEETDGLLGLELAAVDLELRHFHGGLVGALRELRRRTSDALGGRLARRARSDYDGVFGSIEALRECADCGRPLPAGGAGEEREDPADLSSCELCDSLRGLEARLRSPAWRVRRRVAPEALEGHARALARIHQPVEIVSRDDAIGDPESVVAISGGGPFDAEILENLGCRQSALVWPLPATPLLGGERERFPAAFLELRLDGVELLLHQGLEERGDLSHLLAISRELGRYLAWVPQGLTAEAPGESPWVLRSHRDGCLLAGPPRCLLESLVAICDSFRNLLAGEGPPVRLDAALIPAAGQRVAVSLQGAADSIDLCGCLPAGEGVGGALAVGDRVMSLSDLPGFLEVVATLRRAPDSGVPRRLLERLRAIGESLRGEMAAAAGADDPGTVWWKPWRWRLTAALAGAEGTGGTEDRQALDAIRSWILDEERRNVLWLDLAVELAGMDTGCPA